MNLKEVYPDLYRYIENFPADGKGTAFPMLVKLSEQNKSDINARLGLEDGTIYIPVETKKITETKATAIKALTYFLPDEIKKECMQNDYKALIENRLSDGRRVSKILLKYLNSTENLNINGVFYMYRQEVQAQLSAELPMFNSTNLRHLQSIEMFREIMQTFVQNFYSSIAVDKQKISGFSTELFTMLSAATTTAFTSCFSLGGCNSRGPYMMAIHPRTGVVFIKTNNRITGRAWMNFSKDMSVFQVMRPYGFISDRAILNVIRWLTYQIAPNDEWEYVKDRGRTHLASSAPGWWLDPVYISVINRTVQSDRNVRYGVRVMHSVQSPCLICGKIHEYNEAICGDCAKKHLAKCSVCKKVVYVETKSSSDVVLCSECTTKRKLCPICGTVLVNDICPQCSWHNVCFTCGETKSDIRFYNGYPICGDCRKLLIDGKCEVCGKTTTTYVYKGHAYCYEHYVQTIHDSVNK